MISPSKNKYLIDLQTFWLNNFRQLLYEQNRMTTAPL